MSTCVIRIKRKKTGPAGPPENLDNGEMAFDEVGEVLYYGKGKTNQIMNGQINVIPLSGETEIIYDGIIDKGTF